MALYLITGGCGFIGSHLAEELLARGHRVRIIDNLSTGKISNLSASDLPAQCDIVIGDVSHKSTLNQCFEGVDFCFHLAAIAGGLHLRQMCGFLEGQCMVTSTSLQRLSFEIISTQHRQCDDIN